MSTPERLPNSWPGPVTVYLHGAAARACAMLPPLGEKLRNAGQIADFVRWQRASFGRPAPAYWTREALWRDLAGRLDPSRPLVVFEFGVAWGYATQVWLEMLGRRPLEWHGFDRFTGLPRARRDMDAGTFDAGGQTPPLEDERLSWHVGDLDRTLPLLDLAARRDAQWLALFDLDLYEPTAVAFRTLAPLLRRGDLLYFDEAMDEDERRVLDEFVLPSGTFRALGATGVALALEVVSAPAAA